MTDTMTMKNKAQDVVNTLGREAHCVTDSLKNAAGCVGDAAKDVGSNISQAGQQAASYLGHKAEDATSAVGGGFKAAGDAIRQNAPHDGTLGQASSAVAKTLENTGNYLQQEGLEGIASDMANMIKKNPIPSLLIGVGVGYLLARSTTSRS